MDPVQSSIEAYVGVARRFRWFLLASITVACLLATHVYLEQFGYQKAQFEEVRGRRAAGAARRRLDSMRRQIERQELSRAGATDEERAALLQEFGALQTRVDSTTNTLEDERFAPRVIPLLDYEVPANDYFVVAGLLLTVTTVGVWLCARQVHASMQALCRRDDPGIVEIARLHFVFTGPADEAGALLLGRVVQTGAILLPVVVYWISVSIDVYGLLDGSEPFYVRGPVLARVALTAAFGAAVTTAGLSATRVLQRADRLTDVSADDAQDGQGQAPRWLRHALLLLALATPVLIWQEVYLAAGCVALGAVAVGVLLTASQPASAARDRRWGASVVVPASVAFGLAIGRATDMRTTTAETAWTQWETPVALGRVRVALLRARSEVRGTGADRRLTLALRVTNVSESELVRTTPWSAASGLAGAREIELTDEFGNRYACLDDGFDRPPEPAGTRREPEPRTLYPGATQEQTLVFEGPVARASALRLVLSPESVGGVRPIRFNIPVSHVPGAEVK